MSKQSSSVLESQDQNSRDDPKEEATKEEKKEEENKSSEIEPLKEENIHKIDEESSTDDPRVTLKIRLTQINNSVQVLKNYGVEWLLEWTKSKSFKIWTQERNESIKDRSINNPQAKQHLWLYKNGDIYLGDLAYGKREGLKLNISTNFAGNGQFLYKHSRLIYKGGWLNDKRSGNGVLSSLEGTDLLYDGEFKNDKKHGFGRLIQGKEKYTGNFVK